MIEDITDISNIIVMDPSGNNIELNNEDIKMIMNQTNYSYEESRLKLIEMQDPIIVIKHYMNPNYDDKNNKKKQIKSLNQEIYSQIREEFYNVKLNAIKY